MRINLSSGQSIFGPQMQNPTQRTIGQLQSSSLQKVIQQVNTNYGSKRNSDMVDLSKKALEMLDTLNTEKE